MALTVEEVQRLAALVSRERLDVLEFEGLRITKSLHATEASRAAPAASEEDEDDLLYHSSEA